MDAIAPHGSMSCPTYSGLQCVTQSIADMPDFGGRLSATTVSSAASPLLEGQRSHWCALIAP
jgi:hypothetical protein